eukprot:9117091-Pyramimonas_sp.AAC.1
MWRRTPGVSSLEQVLPTLEPCSAALFDEELGSPTWKTCGVSSTIGMVPQSSPGAAALDTLGPPASQPLASS